MQTPTLEAIKAAIQHHGCPNLYRCVPQPTVPSLVLARIEQAARAGKLRIGDDAVAWDEESGAVTVLPLSGKI